MRIIMTTAIALILSVFALSSFAGDQHKVNGVVKAIKSGEKKITVKHGPIESLGMMGMTMDFKVYDPSMLDEVKEGHKISMMIEQDKDGSFVIMELEDGGMAGDSMMGDDHGHEGMKDHMH